MKRLTTLFALLSCCTLFAQQKVSSPDGRIEVSVSESAEYSITYDGKDIIEPSRLGLKSNLGDFTVLKMTDSKTDKISEDYTLDRIKSSVNHYEASRLICDFENADGKKMAIEFRVSDDAVAFRYNFERIGSSSIRIFEEATAFKFPSFTTTFLTPQSDAMIGWKRTKPSYEEYYTADAPMDTKSQYGHGYTFPCLFHVGDNGWALVSETGVDSHYCGSRLSDWESDGYKIAFPMAEENNGNGTPEPAFALPGSTAWRTIALGNTLKPVVESTVTWDVVKPLYETKNQYKYGKGTWSWILWQDGSINYEDQVKYVDLAAAMNFQYFLVDNWWDQKIGYDRIEDLVKYAKSKGIEPFLWYSSSGYWNDIEQSPLSKMDNSIIRKREMDWLQKIGVKGIKVDFFGGDKQETIRLYEEILSDADDHGLMVIFHGCTIPRGWERMYPNYVGSEAVRASENLIFGQRDCNLEAFNACLHPFIRNAIGCMEFGGCFLNKYMNKTNSGPRGNVRRVTDDFELATAVLFQNPIQNFALAPNNLEDAPAYCLDFLREVPTTWDEVRYIDGYPGKYTVIARRKGDKWYIGVMNAAEDVLNIKLMDLAAEFGSVAQFRILHDGSDSIVKVTKKASLSVPQNDGAVIIVE